MKTATKLWVGFGTLTFVIIATALAILASVHSIEAKLTRMEDVTAPRTLAARQLEISVFRFTSFVRDHITGFSPEHTPPIETLKQSVTENIEAYERLAETPHQREMAEQFTSLWKGYVSLGERLATASGDRVGLDKEFAGRRAEIVDFIHNQMVPDSYDINLELRRGTLREIRTVVLIVIVLMIAGALIAVSTSLVVGRGIIHSERLMQEGHERFRVTLSSIGDAVIATDKDGNVTFLNPVAEALTRWTSADAAGHPLVEVFRIINENTRQPAENPAERSLREGIIVGLANHTVLIGKDGHETPIDDSAAPIRGEDGKISGVVLVFRDISERRMAEEKLAHLAAIITSSDDAIVSKDLNGVVQTWNHGAEKLFGYLSDEIVGKPITIIIPPELQDDEPRFLERIRRGERIEHFETVRRRKDGSSVDISLTVSPIHDAYEHVIGAAKIARNISDRKLLEKQISEQAEALASESRRKDEFLAMLSHELRNPLAPIRSAVHLLKRQAPGNTEAAIQKPVEIIERQVTHLTKLVSDLLEVSRVISGRIRLNKVVIDVNEVVRHAIESVKTVVEEHGHELVTKMCPDGLWVSADATRIEEVVVNLLNNAAKYTDPGGRIEVHCEQHDDQWIRISVRDNGIGIEPELMPRIFDLFTQADRSLARSAGGLGVGLSLAQRLVNLHGGKLEAKSPHDDGSKGSEFAVTLPAVPAPDPVHGAQELADSEHAVEIQRVLVVDDNVDQVLMVASALRHEGHLVETAHTGNAGLELALNWKPDVVLLDIGLPGIDGFEVARRIRADGRGRTMRIIAVTGYGRDADIATALDVGIDVHLTKPYDLDELQKILRRS